MTTNLEGECKIIGVQDDLNVIKHVNIEGHLKSNIAYSSHTAKFSEQEAGVFLIGSENKLATKYKFDKTDYEIEKLG